MRSPDGSESAGTAVIEAPETAVVEKTTPETEGAGETEAKAEAPKVTDWDLYQKMIEKYERNPSAKPTKAEIALKARIEGKEEHQIAGYKKPAKGTPEPEEAPAKAKAAEETDPVEDELEPVYKAVGAKDKTQLAEKVKGLVNEVKKLSGTQGEVGRLLKSAGVQDIKGLTQELQGSRILHQLVEDLKAGKPEAFNFIGVKGAPPAQEKYTGERPENVLDDGLFDYVAPQLKAANDRAEALERKLAAMEGKLAPWERDQANNAAIQARNTQKSNIINEMTTLIDSTEGLWDSKKSGPLAKALHEYYDTPADAAHHPDLNPILEILEIARTKNLPDLETALALWERKNGGSLIAKARAEAREPFIGKAPNVGLSDRQGNHNGQFKTFTEATVKEMAAGRRPIPREWTDAQGTFLLDKVPAHLQRFIKMED
jgi:hypothetical protein